MANIKSQKKRIEIAERNHAANASFKTRMRHSIKDVEVAVAAGDKKKAEALLPIAEGNIDKAVKLGIEHKNTGARQKSHLMTKVAHMVEGQAVSAAAVKAEAKAEEKAEKAKEAEAK